MIVLMACVLAGCQRRVELPPEVKAVGDVLNPDGRRREVVVAEKASETARNAADTAKAAAETAKAANEIAQESLRKLKEATDAPKLERTR